MNRRNVKRLLKAARRLLVEKGWTKGAYGRDVNSLSVGVAEPATCFCAMGALMSARNRSDTSFADLESFTRARRILKAALPKGYDAIESFNDSKKSVRPILALYDRAIAACDA